MPEPAHNTRTTKTQVTNVALQTDSCNTLYITKNTLMAYTIAVVQNAQVLQYDQMHVALQTARKSSLPRNTASSGRTNDCTFQFGGFIE